MNVSKVVSNEVAKAVSAIFNEEISPDFFQIENTKADFVGDQTLVVFPLLRITKKSPEQSAELIGEWLVSNGEIFSQFNVVKGFLNLSLKTSFWINQFNSFLREENL